MLFTYIPVRMSVVARERLVCHPVNKDKFIGHKGLRTQIDRTSFPDQKHIREHIKSKMLKLIMIDSPTWFSV
jgi:hypothetical protein